MAKDYMNEALATAEDISRIQDEFPLVDALTAFLILWQAKTSTEAKKSIEDALTRNVADEFGDDAEDDEPLNHACTGQFCVICQTRIMP